MTAIRSKNLFVAAVFSFSLLSISSASAQQITYYDFNTPQAATSPAQSSYTCSPSSSTNPLFCFNGSSGDPSFFSDFYPPFIDPNASTDSDSGSTNYAVQMTPASSGQVSSLWFSVPQNVANGFNSWFAFKFTPNEASSTTADGMAFVIQNSPSTGATTDPATSCGQAGYGPTAYGGGGGCIGYSGINNSLALEFDTYDNGTNWDPNANHIALEDCGAGKPNSADHYYPNTNGQTGTCSVNLGGPNSSSVSTLITNPLTAYISSETNQQVAVTLADGNIHEVVVVYSGPSEATPNQLQVFLDPDYVSGTHTPAPGSIPLFSGTIDLTTALNLATQNPAAGSTCTTANPCTNAFVGFTSATGEFFEQHELMAWTFTPHTTVTTTQPLQPAGSPTYQQFNFGTHTYGTQYPSSGPSTTGISMTLTANTITPTTFSTLIAGTPFQGSSCQVYDDTGGNCIIYSVSCSLTSTGAPAACPSVTNIPNCSPDYAADCINVKTVFNSDDSVTPPSPGFLQGDPFYSQIKSLSGSGSLAAITCTGECSVTQGQTVSIVGAQPTGFNGSYTVSSITGVNAFTAQSTGSTALPSSATTGGYLTSSNVQNIFTGYTTQNIDGTSTGKTLNFSDFVFTSITNNATSSIQLGAVTTSPTQFQPDLITATVSGVTGQVAAPTGNVVFYAGSTQICSNPVVTVLNVTTATCSYTPETASPVTITASYQGDLYHLPILSSGLPLTPVAATVPVTIGTSPPGLSFSINGTTFTTPQTPALTVGTGYTLATTSPQTLAVTPGVEYIFSNWSDGIGTLTDLLTPTTSTTGDTAMFNPLYDLTVIAGSGGTTTGSAANGYYSPSSPQSLVATPNAGYYFSGWTGSADVASPSSPSTTVTMNGPETITATFAPIPGYQVTTLIDDPPGSAANCPGTTCSLRDAMLAAEANNGGAGNITFKSGLAGTTTLTAALPALAGQIIMQGPGAKLITVSGNNSATVGSIFQISSGATVSISGLTIANGYGTGTSSNTTGDGGGIFNNGTLAVSASTLSNSTALGAAGAIYNNNSSTLTISDSTFASNSATVGGGAIYTNSGNVTINNSTFSSNTSGEGGAILTSISAVTIRNSTFSNNTAPSGGAITFALGNLNVTNSIFVGNTGPAIHSAGGDNINFNLYYQNYDTGTTTEDDCFNCHTNTNAISGNPDLAPLANYGGPTPTMLPLPSSAAICAASSALIPNGLTTDQRGFPNSTTYNSTACYDLGAVQTNYSLSFTAEPPSSTAVPGTAMSPAPAVTVKESGTILTAGPATVAATDLNSDLTTSPATATTTAGVATFSTLLFNGATSADTLTATLPLNPNNTAINLTTTSTPFSVGAATPTVTWPTASAITYGQSLTASTLTGGSASFGGKPVSGTFAFTHPTSMPGAGLQSESVTFTPGTSGYNSVTSFINVQVNKATPTIKTLPTALAITYGQTLASSKLSGGAAIAPYTGANVTGTFTFTAPATAPTTTGPQSVTFTPSDTVDFAIPPPVSVTVTVTPVPIALVSPTSINFGTAIYFGSIITRTVAITNTGDAAMTISDPLIAIVQGGNSNEFITINLCPKSLAAGKSCTMTVTFIAGPFYTQQNATLKINDNAAGSPQTVSLFATVINPVASLSANSLNFGTVKVGKSSTSQTMTLTNAGGTPLTNISVTTAGTDPADFASTNNCTGTTLQPKKTCTISVTFKPAAKGMRTGKLVITDNAQNSPQSISLTGTGN
ncbi:MAG: choice-of-anchor D domain-containing protein [Acidobacteriaceae bacterium]